MHQFCASFENFILFGLNFLMAYLNLDIPQGKIWKHTRVYHIAKSLTCKKPPTHRLRKNVSRKVEGMLKYRHPSRKRRVYPNGLSVQKSTHRTTRVQGISLQTVQSNLCLREGRKDISDILRCFFSRKHMHVLISKLIFMKKKWEIMKNHKIC